MLRAKKVVEATRGFNCHSPHENAIPAGKQVYKRHDITNTAIHVKSYSIVDLPSPFRS